MKNIILILALSALLGCGSKKEKEKSSEEEPQAVGIGFATPKNLNQSIQAAGIISTDSQIKLAFKTGGLIKKVYVDEGQSIKTGQLLAELDLSEIDAQVNQANIAYNKALRDFERVERLFKDEAATQTNLLDAKTGLDISMQSLKAAQFNQKLSKIYSPINGKVLKKLIEPGELITPFVPAFVVGNNTSSFVVKVGLTDKDIVKVKIGNTAFIEVDAYPEEKFKAIITQIAQMVNPSTGTYEVELSLEQSNKSFITGFVARAFINPQINKIGLMIPISALVEANEDKGIVYVFENGKANKKEIIIGNIIDEYVEVKNGLIESDALITKGGGFLTDGQKVKVIK